MLKLFLTDVDHIVGRFGQSTSISFLKDLFFFDSADTMVVVLSPDALLVIFDVAVVVA